MKYMPASRASSAPAAAAPWRWALGGALTGLLLSTLVFAPARWLAAAVHQASGQQISLLEPRGSLWQGSAQLVLSGGTGSRNAMALPGTLAWRIRPTWNGAVAQITAACCTPQPLQLKAA
ncbi:MAG: type II secretion system protein N, partial [Polaromonas sp.]|nr:type II secretion system protein N [Polaromonas sp.]